MSNFDDVAEFHKKFGLVHDGTLDDEYLTFRFKFMREELDEFLEGWELGDRAKIADALVDLVYVAMGTAEQLGLPWQELWDDVQRANMSKVRGRTKRGSDKWDVTKPEGWDPPHTQEILDAGHEQWVIEHHTKPGRRVPSEGEYPFTPDRCRRAGETQGVWIEDGAVLVCPGCGLDFT